MYFLKKYTKMSYTSIGKKIGNKDHATVIHACRVVKNEYETDAKYKFHIDELNKIFSRKSTVLMLNKN